MIRTQGITKSYGSLQVLKGIDFRVEGGEIISIYGASGAGKTTFLQILGTLDNPDEGDIFYDDVNVRTLKEGQLSRFRNRHIGFVFQFHHLLPEFTALENICIPAFIKGVPKKEAEKQANQLLEFMGLTNRASHKPAELSGGEQQRVAIARALINNPAVVFADEPSGNLDLKASQALHQLFLKLREDLGHTFIIVTHNKELAAMADRTMKIKDGVLFKENNNGI
jgi:lipoprotein-releasing system ATP-binding protein